jgi:Site-specific DNA methylase
MCNDIYECIEKYIDQVVQENIEYIENNFEPEVKKLFPYPGGDFYIFDDLNKFFMRSDAETFVEVFGGSCYSSSRVSREKFKRIICNDIDNLLINIFNMIKNSPEILIRRLSLLPISREIREISRIIIEDPKIDIVTKTVMMFYVLRTSMFGIPTKSGFIVDKSKSPTRVFLKTLSYIKEYSKEIKDVIFENKDYKEILRIYDSEKTLFYLDPPYVSMSPTADRESFFRYSFSLSELKLMANLLKNVKADFVLKIHRDNYDLIKDLLPDHDVEILTKIKNMENVNQDEDRKRDVWDLVIAYRIKRPKENIKLNLIKYLR